MVCRLRRVSFGKQAEDRLGFFPIGPGLARGDAVGAGVGREETELGPACVKIAGGVADEAADVCIALLNYANSRGIDLAKAVQTKMAIIDKKRLD